jgi:Zn-finger nucleic acid-binding protein
MTCPKCHGDMRQYERSGVIIDQCQECRGIFLDRGELERLADAENAYHGRPATPAPAPVYDSHDQRHSRREYDQRDQYHHKKKKHSFFEELFD